MLISLPYYITKQNIVFFLVAIVSPQFDILFHWKTFNYYYYTIRVYYAVYYSVAICNYRFYITAVLI